MSEKSEGNVTTAIIKQLEQDKDVMATWSEDKKKDFVKTMEERVRAARYITLKTAEYVWDKAVNRKFLSQKHARQITGQTRYGTNELRDQRASNYGPQPTNFVGGRSTDDLDNIAKERSESMLKELPTLKNAVQIIAPDVAKMIEKKEKLLEEGKKLQEQLEEISTPVSMAEVDQSMSVAQFRQTIKDLEDKRHGLVRKLDKIGIEGNSLEDIVNKRLYSGLPGLSDAVIKVINDHFERSKALDQLGRRAGEKVLFGDSDAATDILKTFEKDELTIEDSIKNELADAMTKLKIAMKKGKVPKELKGATSAKKK